MKKIPLNLVYLKYFVEAVKHNSISASAQINCVSQSAISQGISKLEVMLESVLLDHQPNRFKVTPSGKKLFECSHNIFQAIRNAEESFADNQIGSISFACTHSFALALLPKYLRKIHKALPHLRFSFKLAHAFDITEWVKKGIVDFGILLDNVDLSAFDCEKIYEGFYRLYVSKQSKENELGYLLDSEERLETNLLKKNYQKKYGKELPVTMEISSWEVVATLAEQGLGIGFIPDYVALRHPNLKPYHIQFVKHPYTLNVLFAKNSLRSHHVTEFVKHLYD